MNDQLLEISDLVTSFRTETGWHPAVNGVSLSLRCGEVLGIVGESGSGKTATVLSLMRLLPPNGRIESGRISFEGSDILALSRKQMREIRGRKIGMIFQDPMSALDPVYSCGAQISEVLQSHVSMSRREIRDRSIEMLSQVGIKDPEKLLRSYPHELSGGMCQRVMIAMALAMNPTLLIADEPTTALDVTVQAMILDLLKELRAQHDMSMLFISHDLGVVADIADRVVVMYGGDIVEQGAIRAVFNSPLHPYTQGLIASVPRLDEKQTRLFGIPGIVPDIEHFPAGCRFSNRCPHAAEICKDRRPPMHGTDEHAAACWAKG